MNINDLVDNNGNLFNPDLHVTRANGKPKLTKLGRLRLKPKKNNSSLFENTEKIEKIEDFNEFDSSDFMPENDTIKARNDALLQQVRAENAEKEAQKEAENSAYEYEKEQQAKFASSSAKIKEKNEYLAHVCAGLFLNAGVAFVGSKFRPVINDKVDEYNELHGDFKMYLETVPDFDIPPGWALAIGLGGYTIKHMKGETEKETLWHKTKDWFSRKKAQWNLNKQMRQAQTKKEAESDH
jgi:hypothetical protein